MNPKATMKMQREQPPQTLHITSPTALGPFLAYVAMIFTDFQHDTYQIAWQLIRA